MVPSPLSNLTLQNNSPLFSLSLQDCVEGVIGNDFEAPSQTGNKFANLQRRFESSYVGKFTHKVRDADASSDAGVLSDLGCRTDPERVIRLFESRPSLHSNPSAFVEYVKALIKSDMVDESELLKKLQRGLFVAPREKGRFGCLLTLQNLEKSTKDGILGTASTPIPMMTPAGSLFTNLLWNIFHAVALGFVLISGVGALIKYLGIDKVLSLNEVRSTYESNTKFSDVKGVDEAKAELEEIVHYLRDPSGSLV